MFVRRYCFLIFSVVLLLSGIASCKKGCTDSKALNYTSNAKEEDGTCQFCDSTSTDFQTLSQLLYDDNFQSPHYNQYVINLTAQIKKETFTGNACKIAGHDVATGCERYFVFVTLANLTNSTVTVNCPLYVGETSTSAYIYQNVSATIAPNSTINMGSEGNICVSQVVSFPSFNLNASGSTFNYQ